MFENDWDIILKEEIESSYFKNIISSINDEYKKNTCFPKYEDIFKCLKLTNYNDISVVILGQDPYHGYNEAMGLAFSTPNNIKRPPSLANIFKELNDDIGIKRQNNDLTDWAKQGVLLLNTILTVQENKPLSHQKIGWEQFTDIIIKKINQKSEPVVFVLWGNNARSKKNIIDCNKHYIIESVHPSPLSAYRGFLGSKPFSKTNNYLKQKGLNIIDWS